MARYRRGDLIRRQAVGKKFESFSGPYRTAFPTEPVLLLRSLTSLRSLRNLRSPSSCGEVSEAQDSNEFYGSTEDKESSEAEVTAGAVGRGGTTAASALRSPEVRLGAARA